MSLGLTSNFLFLFSFERCETVDPQTYASLTDNIILRHRIDEWNFFFFKKKIIRLPRPNTILINFSFISCNVIMTDKMRNGKIVQKNHGKNFHQNFYEKFFSILDFRTCSCPRQHLKHNSKTVEFQLVQIRTYIRFNPPTQHLLTKRRTIKIQFESTECVYVYI